MKGRPQYLQPDEILELVFVESQRQGVKGADGNEIDCEPGPPGVKRVRGLGLSV